MLHQPMPRPAAAARIAARRQWEEKHPGCGDVVNGLWLVDSLVEGRMLPAGGHGTGR